MSEVHMSFLFILHIQLLGKCFWFSSKELSYTQMKTYKVITREQRGIPRRIRMYPILMDPHGHHQQKPQSWIRINPPYIHTDPSWECHSILIWLVGQGHPSEKWWSSSIKGWWKKPNMNGKIKKLMATKPPTSYTKFRRCVWPRSANRSHIMAAAPGRASWLSPTSSGACPPIRCDASPADPGVRGKTLTKMGEISGGDKKKVPHWKKTSFGWTESKIRDTIEYHHVSPIDFSIDLCFFWR